jgi:uncharacterized damage-inducible protein DinB
MVRRQGLINTLIHATMDIKVIITQLAAYDMWACRRFVDRLAKEDPAVLDRPVPNSFPSLRATLLHIRDAEHVWLCRLKGEKHSWPAEASTEIGTLPDHCQKLHDHVMALEEEHLLKEVVYADLRGNTYRQPAWQLLLHCFNHGTQHRGQLITMMRTLELKDIPANDLVVFQRQSMALL